MALLDVSIVNVALPSIQAGLGANESDIQLVVAGYALTFGVLQVASGRAGDLFGREGLFIIGVAGFTAASVWSGLAGHPTVLNVARAVQGLCSGLIVPQVIGMIQQYFRGPERGRAFGIFGGVVGVAVAIGPTLGGFLIHLFGLEHGWRTIFFVNLPVGLVAITLALAWFPRPLLARPRSDGQAPPPGRDLDPVGTVLLGVAVLLAMLPFVLTSPSGSGPSRLVWLLLPAGLATLSLWVLWERWYRSRGRSPMVDVGIFRVASFRSGTALLGLYFFGMTSIWVVLNLYFQEGLHHSALASGLVGLPSAVGTGLAAVWSGRRVARYGRSVVVGGIWIALIGIAACALVVWLHSTAGISEWWLMLALTIFGIGGGAVVSPNQTLTLEDVPLEYAGSSGGIMQTVQQLGASVGLAAVTSVTFKVLASKGWTAAFVVSLAVVAALISFSQLVAYTDLRRRRRERSARSAA